MSENNEIWQPVKGYEGLYEVSSRGNVRSLNYKNMGITKGIKIKEGKVTLYKSYRSAKKYVDNLVYEAFVGAVPRGHIVVNKDGNSENNDLENLLLMAKD